MGDPKLLEVGWFDDRLKVKGCPGFALKRVVSSFREPGDPLIDGEPPDNNSPAGNAIGEMEAYGGQQLSVWDYFALAFGGTAPQNTVADIYNFTWIVGGVNGTDFLEGGQPAPISGDVSVYVVVDSDDETQVVAGFMNWVTPFTYSDERTDGEQGYCINPFQTIWSPAGGGLQIRSNAQDSSGYFARSVYPIGGRVNQPENTFTTQWNAIFPPPGWVDFLGNKAGPDPQYPMCLVAHATSDQSGNHVELQLKCPKTDEDLAALRPPGPLDCTVDSLRANAQLSGGLNYSIPPDLSCTFPFEADGYVGTATGKDERITIFYFLCGGCCVTQLDYIAWIIGIHTSHIKDVYIPPTPTITTGKVP